MAGRAEQPARGGAPYGSWRFDHAAFAAMVALAAVGLAISGIELTSRFIASRAVRGGQPGLETAARLSPLDWSVRFVLGEVAAAAGRPERAARWYADAIDRNPACAECALGLAEVESRLGRDPDPWLAHAIRYGRSTAAVRVRAGTLYARLGRHDEATREFAAGALGQRENKKEFFALLHRIYPHDVVLDKIIPDAILPEYFAFAQFALGPLAIQKVWERYERMGLGATSRDEYVTYLLRHGLAHQAWNVRFNGEAPPLGTLLNGDFEEHETNAGFSWRAAEAEGVRARISECDDCMEQGHALVVEFDGETNAHYAGARVDVAARPGALYRLTARIKGSGLTSAQGPALAVMGLAGLEQDPTYACSFRVMGELFRGTFDWRSTSLVFRVPGECEGIEISVTRLRTKRLDKFIGGELWVDDVVLEEMVSSPSPSSAKTAEEGGLGGSVGAIIGAITVPAPIPQSEIDTSPR